MRFIREIIGSRSLDDIKAYMVGVMENRVHIMALVISEYR